MKVTVWHEVLISAPETYSPSRDAHSTKVAVLLPQCMMNFSSDHGHLSKLDGSLTPVGLIREWALTIDTYMSDSV